MKTRRLGFMTVLLSASMFYVTAASAAFQVDTYVLPGVHINTLAEANTAISSGVQTDSSTFETINFTDSANHPGHFGNNNNFPANSNNFALHVTTTITVASSGIYTFGTHADDGLRLKIGGNTVIYDDSNHVPQDRFGTVNLAAGTHTLDLVFWEQGGIAAVELFVAQGNFNYFNNNFTLLSSTDGGSGVTTGNGTVPAPAAPLLLGAGILAFAASRRRNKRDEAVEEGAVAA